MRNAAAAQPLMLLLEDLRWADKGTLEQLLHLGRGLAGTRVFIVGTYRDVKVDRGHPLSGALAELRRLGTFLRVPVRGLTDDEVQALVDVAWPGGVPRKVAVTVCTETEGNPLFVHEVLRHLQERGMQPADVADDLGDRVPLGVPEGIRDIVGKRLSGLSESANQVLASAAVLGREFRLELLQKVSNATEDQIIDALEEAAERGIVEERTAVGAGVTYRFRQAFFRELLYDELRMPRRVRMHQQAGRALEQLYGRRLEEHAAELAVHFQHSPDPADLRKGLEYCELAARRALDAHSYKDAGMLFEHALDVQQVLDPDNDAKRCDLWLALAAAQAAAGEPMRAVRGAAEKAYGIASERGDRARGAQVCVVAIGALGQHRGSALFGDDLSRTWLERAQRDIQPGSKEYASVATSQYYRLLSEARYAEADSEMDQGLVAAQQTGATIALAMVGSVWLLYLTPARYGARARMAADLLRIPNTALDPVAAAMLTRTLACDMLAAGERTEADKLLRSLGRLAANAAQPSVRREQWYEGVLHASYTGQLAETARLASAPNVAQDQADSPLVLRITARLTLRPLIDLGRAEEADALVNDARLSGWGVGQRWMAVWPSAARGHTEATVTALDLLLAGLSPADLSHVPARYLLSGLTAAVAVGHRFAAAALAEALAPMAEWSDGWSGVSVARLLGD